MDASNSAFEIKNFKISELFDSKDQAEREQAIKANQIICDLYLSLAPIVHYITVPVTLCKLPNMTMQMGIRSLNLRVFTISEPCPETNSRTLLFNDNGDEGELILTDAVKTPCNCTPLQDRPHYHDCIPVFPRDLPFGFFFEGIKKALDSAVSKREAHLRTIRERATLLDSIQRLFEKP
jgi:hypothetical protein